MERERGQRAGPRSGRFQLLDRERVHDRAAVDRVDGQNIQAGEQLEPLVQAIRNMTKSEPRVPAVRRATANGCGFNVTLRPICSRLCLRICARATEVGLVV